jgi:predicted nucleic acid-binding protein
VVQNHESSGPTDLDATEEVLKEFLGEVAILEVTRALPEPSAKKWQLRKAGIPMADPDILIAASGLRHNLMLLTSDRAFERVEEL